MKSDLKKTKTQLIEELEGIRQKVSELEAYKTSYLATEKELRENEEKLRLMFESVSDGITVTDLNGNITDVNRAVLKLGGFESESGVVGISAFENIAIRDRERALADMLELRQQGTVGSGQYHLLRTDGSEYPADVSAGLLRDAAGNPAGFVSVIRDITERKKAEETLRESEERYKNLVELAPDAIISVEENGIVISCNQAFAQQTGYAKQELVGKFFTELPTMSSPDNTEVYNKLFAALSGGGALESFEFPWIHKDGTLRWGEVHATVVMANGQFKGAQAIMRDITERKQAEEIFQTVSLRSPVGMYIVQDGKFVFANPWLLENLGFSADELFATEPQALVHPEDREMVQQNTIAMLNGTRTTPYEFKVFNKAGEIRWFMETLTPIQYREGRAFLGNAIDITERKLAEEIFQTVSLRSPIGMYIVQDGKFVFANPQLLSDLGVSEERLLGTKPLSRVRSEDREMVRQNAVEMLKGISTTPYEYGVAYRGGIRWFMETVVPIQYQGKRAVLGNLLDITERKQTEERLRETRRRFRDLVNLLPVGVYEIDENYTVTFANQAAIRASGYTEEELYTAPLNALQVCIPDDRERMKRNIQRIMTGENLGGVEYTYTRRDGTTYPVVVYSAPVMWDGKAAGLRGVNIDITEQKQAAEEHRIIIKTALDGFWLSSLDGEFLEANDSYCVMTGYTREELLKMSIADIEAVENPKMVAHHIKNIVEQGYDRFETKHRRKDGEIIDVEVSVNYLGVGEGQLFVFIRDITERKRVEEERQRIERLESLGTLAGGIAHDFNNILTGIMGNIGLALRHVEPEGKAAERLLEAEKASLRARDLTQQLLTFSKGGAPVKKSVVIGQLVEEAASFALRGSNVRFELSIPDNIWQLHIDEGQINGVISNLVINADEAMPQGGTIKIGVRNKTVGLVKFLPLPRGNYVEVTVEDHGVGIQKKYLDRIFEPYFTTKQRGSGLGLATAYSIVKNHDGCITVESKLGVGTTFHVFLPASKKSAPLEGEINDNSSAPVGGRILVMDDEESIRQLLHRALTEVGYEVLLTVDGEEAIEQYIRAREAGDAFDAVILDLTVPGKMGGREAIKKLLETDPEVLAIASSGYSTDPVISDFRNYGFSGVVLKPYRISELREALREVVARRLAL